MTLTPTILRLALREIARKGGKANSEAQRLARVSACAAMRAAKSRKKEAGKLKKP